MKSGHPLYPMDQGVPYQAPAVIFPPWTSIQAASMLPPPTSAQQGQGPPPPPTIVSGPPHHPHHHPHAMYPQAPQLRPPIGFVNPAIPSFMHLSHGPGPEGAPAFLLPMQQLQQLQIANGPGGPFCVVNPHHPPPAHHSHAHSHGPTIFMPPPQPQPPAPAQAQAQAQSQAAAAQSAVPPSSQHDPSLAASQVNNE